MKEFFWKVRIHLQGVGIDRKGKDTHQGRVAEKVASVDNQSLSLLGTLGARVEYALQAGGKGAGGRTAHSLSP